MKRSILAAAAATILAGCSAGGGVTLGTGGIGLGAGISFPIGEKDADKGKEAKPAAKPAEAKQEAAK